MGGVCAWPSLPLYPQCPDTAPRCSPAVLIKLTEPFPLQAASLLSESEPNIKAVAELGGGAQPQIVLTNAEPDQQEPPGPGTTSKAGLV